MYSKFNSARWNGRFLGAILHIGKQKHITLNSKEEQTFLHLLVKVMEVASDEEKEIISQLMKKTNSEKENEQNGGVEVPKDAVSGQEKIGMQDAAYVAGQYGSLKKLLEETDFAEMQRKADEEKKKEQEKKNKKKERIIFGIVAAIILCIVLYNTPFFAERRFYKEVKKEKSIYKCMDYYEEYPNGRHYEDVMYLEMGLQKQPVGVMTQYLNKFPNGKYAEEINQKYDSMWNKEIAKYEIMNKGKESSKAVTYMTEMLKYMKENRVNTIIISISPDIRLKDFEEYDETARYLAEAIGTSETLPLEGNMVSLKKNFSEQDKATLIEILSSGVKESFNRMFSADFIQIEPAKRNKSEAKCPRLSFNYTIKNIEDTLFETNYPEIWAYTTNNVPQSYLLGIDVEFNANFSIPGSETVYNYSETGDPGSEISGISSIKDGYRRMTQACFSKFSKKMATSMGLEEAY